MTKKGLSLERRIIMAERIEINYIVPTSKKKIIEIPGIEFRCDGGDKQYLDRKGVAVNPKLLMYCVISERSTYAI